MNEKGGKSVFLKFLLVSAFILIANAGVIAYKYGKNFTGFSISEGVERTYSEISSLSKILFVIQWGVIIFVLLFVFIFERAGNSKKKDIAEISSRKLSGNSSTDLDALYSALQEKKKLKLSTISKAFGINAEVAMEWCKILEAGNLAVIDYPGIGEPVIKLGK